MIGQGAASRTRLGRFSAGRPGGTMSMNGDNLNPYTIVELTDWENLENSDGPAFPDTPAKLRDLASGDLLAVTSSFTHLYGPLLNDGVVYSATVPAFRYVAALLGDRPSRPALTPSWEEGKFPVRGRLLAWLADVAFDVSVDQERRIREWADYSPDEPFPDFLGIRSSYPEAFLVVSSYFGDPDPRVVEAALVAAVRFLENPELAAHCGEVAPLVESVLAQSSNRWHRKLASEALEAWGQGRVLIESHDDPGSFGGPGKNGNPREMKSSMDEPPF